MTAPEMDDIDRWIAQLAGGDYRLGVERLVEIGQPALLRVLAIAAGDEPLKMIAGRCDFREFDDNMTGALFAIGERYLDEFVAALTPTLLDHSGVVWALGNIQDSRVVDPLIQALCSKYSGTRWAAAVCLGQHRDARAIQPLIKALADPDSLVRFSSQEALVAIGAEAIEPLQGILAEGQKKHGSRRVAAATRILRSVYSA